MMRILKTILPACALICASAAANASPYTVRLIELGSLEVFATGSGQIDLTGLTFTGPGFTIIPFMDPQAPSIATGAGVSDFYVTKSITGPSTFGSGPVTVGAGGGDIVALEFTPGGSKNSGIFVPQGYVSDTALSDSAVYPGATFASLGVTPGIYVWTWGTRVDQSFTLEIGTPVVPLPGALPLFATGLAGLGLLGWRRKRAAAA